MTIDDGQKTTRRGVIAAGALVAVAGLTAPVAAAPPLKKDPKPAPDDGAGTLAKIDHMTRTIDRIQGSLAGCDGDVCATVLEHSFVRKNLTLDARGHVEDGDDEAATTALLDVREIVEGDIVLLEGVADRGTVGETLGLERALLNQTNAALADVSDRGVMPGDNVS